MFSIEHLSAGDLLRQERATGSSDGSLIDKIISEGKIVPVEITIGLLKRAMESSTSQRFLIDGFPRNWDNLNGWEKTMNGLSEVESVLFIDCDESESRRRLLDRGLTSGRSDDNEESAKKRFITYRESTLPIINYFSQQKKVLKINGNNSLEEVANDITSAFRTILEKEKF